MFEIVEAIRFYEEVPVESGAAQPLLLAVDHNGEEIDVFAKLSGQGGITSHSLAKEAICSFLARDLEIPCPEPYLVSVSDEFINSQPNPISTRLQVSVKPIFGCKRLTGAFTAPKAMKLEGTMRQNAAHIFAFDMLVGNADRGGPGAKPNCLVGGGVIYAIDHEKCFSGIDVPLIGVKFEPWKVGGLQFALPPSSHLFTDSLRSLRSKPDFNDFMTKWRTVVTNERIALYTSALPNEWKTNLQGLKNIVDGLTNIRDRIEACVTEVTRVIAGK